MQALPPRLRPLWPYAKAAHVALTRTVSPLARRLDARRGGWLPRTVAASTDAALAVPGTGEAVVLAPPHDLARTPPRGLPAATPLAAQTRASFPARRVLLLTRGRVLGRSRAVITHDGALLTDETRYFGTRRGSEQPVWLARGTGAPREVGGDLVVLASRGDANYYHFLHDVLPRLDLLERWGGAAHDAPVYLPATTRFQRELAGLAGVDAGRVLDADAVPHVRADRLVVPTLPALDLDHPQWATDFLRARLRPSATAVVPGRTIYVTRGHARHTRVVRNEDAVLAALEPYGVRVVDPGTLPVAGQIDAFATAELIVAPHGAALANLVFASPGASVVELFAPDYVQGCYWKLATTVAGLRYRYLVGRGHAGRVRTDRGVASDIIVDPDRLRCVLDDLTAGRSASGV